MAVPPDTVRRDLALLRIRANLALDPVFDLIADLVDAVFRRRVVRDREGRLILDATSAGLIRSDISTLLVAQRDDLVQAIGFAVRGAETLADTQMAGLGVGRVPSRINPGSVLIRVRTLVERAIGRVVNQIGRVLANAVQFGHAAGDVAVRIERYLRPTFAHYRNQFGKLIRDNVAGRLTNYPGASGNGLYPFRLIAWREITDAHRGRMETVAAAGRYGVKWLLSPAHRGADVCDRHATRDNGWGPGIYAPGTMPEPPHAGCQCTSMVVPLVTKRTRATS